MTERQLSDYVPFATVRDNCVLSKRGDMTYGWRIELPTAFSVNERDYDSIINSFQQAYKLLPPYCVIHKQDIYRYDRYRPELTGSFLADSYERHFEGRRYLNGYCYLYLTFSSKSVIEGNSSTSAYFRRITSPMMPKPEQIEENAAVASRFEAVMDNNQLIRMVPLTTDDFLRMDENGVDQGVIPDYMRVFSDTPALDYPMDPDKDCYRYGDVVQKAWYVEDSDAMPETVSSVSYIGDMSTASSKVFLSGGSAIGYQLRIPHVVNRYCLTLPRKTVEMELDNRHRFMTSFSLYSKPNAVNAAELEKYLYDAALMNTTTVKCFTDVLAWGTEEEMPKIRNRILAAFADLDVTVCEETKHCGLLHYAGIPGAAAELGFEKYMNSEQNAFLCHGLWDGYEADMKGGVMKLNDRRRMIPIRFDIQSVARNMGLIDNLNAIIVGPSGSGKSFTTNKLVECYYGSDQHILIIDVGDSYETQCRIINEESGGKDGIYNTYDPNHPFSFNPFKGRKHWDEVDEDGDRTSSGYDFIISLLQTMYMPKDGWTKEASSVLDSLLLQFFDYWDNGYPEQLAKDLKQAHVNRMRERAKANDEKFIAANAARGFKNRLPLIFRDGDRPEDPIFDNFYQYITFVVLPLVEDGNCIIGDTNLKEKLFDVDAFHTALEKYKQSGTYGFLLNAETEVDLFASRLTVFEVDKIKDNKDLFPLWTLCIMHSFEEKMRTLRCQKVMIIEEAWKAISIDTMANFIVWMWRTARKFRTSAVIVTQSINDLMSSDIVKDAIIVNSAVKILLDQSKHANNFVESAKVMAMTPKDVNLTLSVGKNMLPEYGKYKEVFISIGQSSSNVYAVEVSLEERLAFETEKTTKEPLLARGRQLGSYIEAVKELAAYMRENNIRAMDEAVARFYGSRNII